MLAPDDADVPKAPPCASCGTPTRWKVWGHWLCGPCMDVWKEAAPALPVHGEISTQTAAMARWTTAWVAGRRKLRGAA